MRTLRQASLLRQTIIGAMIALMALPQSMVIQSLSASSGFLLSIEPEKPAVAGSPLQLHLHGGSNNTLYVVQSSTNLVDWQPVTRSGSGRGHDVVLAEVVPTNNAQFFTVREFPVVDKLLAAADDNGRVFVFYVQTNGSFSPGSQIATLNSDARGLGIGDFDNDGLLDLITGGASGDTLTPYFFKGNGDGTFAAPVALPTAQGANSYMMGAAVGDFDCDGNLDFVCDGNERYVFFYWGNGDGTFTVEVKDWGCCGRSLAAGDFNEDGREDLARGTYSDGLVRLFLSNGDRTFTETNMVGAFGDDPYGVVAGDFDEDGHLDLIVNGGRSGDVGFYKGLGNGTFASLSTSGALANLDLDDYAAFATGDYNSDGHLDIALTTYYTHSVYFLPGNGDGTFSTNRLTLSTALGASLGIAAPPRPPRVEVDIAPVKPVV
ncbi:MAG: VCBS repeat-containing protein, partial [Verrucomicrobia bacterium]|nr:VCBS repeat-containing protein [Verrucomicrobiota bacterium]